MVAEKAREIENASIEVADGRFTEGAAEQSASAGTAVGLAAAAEGAAGGRSEEDTAGIGADPTSAPSQNSGAAGSSAEPEIPALSAQSAANAAPDVHIALVGMKNSGKSALFNALTGRKAHVGNYPGVTTESTHAPLKSVYGHAPAGAGEVHIIDMPGMTSLIAYSPEEQDALDLLLHDTPDVLVDVVDVGHLSQGLYLALQLLDLRIPMVIAISMMDEAQNAGVSVDVKGLSRALEVPVVPISTVKGQGVTELMATALGKVGTCPPARGVDFCSGDLHKAIHSIAHMIEDHAQASGIPVRYAAEKFVEHDPDIARLLGVHDDDAHVIAHIVEIAEQDAGVGGETLLARERYRFVDDVCERCVRRRAQTPEQQRSDAIDKWATHRYLGIPIFLCIMFVVFWLTFSVVGGPLQELLEGFFDQCCTWVGDAMLGAGVSYWLYDLVVNGAMAGVFSVLSFLPIICVLFFLLSILEDSGYMTRVSYVMDKLLRHIGLSGRSFVPLIVGFGCNVPAIMATRTLPSEHDRKLTVLLTPFMSCSAKLPVYGMITAAFFGGNAALVMISLYVMGIVVAVLLGLILSRTVFKGDAMMYVTELPAYRVPALSDVLRHMWDNASEFVKKAFTIIFVGTVVIWFLQNFDLGFNAVADSADSMLAALGTAIAPVLAPIGLDNWQATTALCAGLAAKEAIVSTLTVLLGGGAELAATAALGTIFTPLTAYVFLVFILLYVPCLATFAAARKELGSTAQALGMVAMQIAVAYAVCFVVYHVGLLF